MTYDEFIDYQESLKKKRKVAEDGEIIVAPMAIMDSWHGVVHDAAETDFFDCTESDAHKGYVDRMTGHDSGNSDTHADYVRRMTTGTGKAGWLR